MNHEKEMLQLMLVSGSRTHAWRDLLVAASTQGQLGRNMACGTESPACSNGRQREGRRGAAASVGAGWDEVGRGSVLKKQTGRGLHRQLEGIRVSDKDLSDAAVAVAD